MMMVVQMLTSQRGANAILANRCLRRTPGGF